ncbi:MAG: hypothetical protein OXR73_03485 [Myxococcales bacterium]|nr:hypothetical protein [Myxococcales bacterium]
MTKAAATGAGTCLVLLLSGLAACSGDAGEAPSTSAGDAGVRATSASPPSSEGQPAGRFTLRLIAASSITNTPALARLQGSVRSAPPHQMMGWLLKEEEGACRLEIPDFPFCDPECPRAQVCVAGDVCSQDPVAVDVGTVTVFGLRTKDGSEEPVTLMRIGPNYQPSASVALDYPPVAPGAPLRLEASGGDHEPFEVGTTGIAELNAERDTPIPFERDRPLRVSWIAAAGERSTIEAVVDISHHGGVKGRIHCAADDQEGHLEVPVSLVTGLYDLGVAGFPIVRLTRSAVGRTGDIEFAAEQSLELNLAIPGITSCLGHEDCPDGQACRLDRTCG